MTIAVAVLLAAAVFAAVAYPFIRHQRTSLTTGHGSSLKELHFRRDHTYAMLKELEGDYQSGTLSEADYKKLERKGKADQAAGRLKQAAGRVKQKVEKRDEVGMMQAMLERGEISSSA